MWRASFEAPPFALWRIIANQRGPRRQSQSGRGNSPESTYRLVPHAVLRTIIWQTVWQWLAFSLAAYYYIAHLENPSYDLARSCSQNRLTCLAIVSFAGLAVFVLLLHVAGLLIIALVNTRPIQTVDALLRLCPEEARREYDGWFPAVVGPRGTLFRATRLALRLTLRTISYFLICYLVIRVGRRLRTLHFVCSVRFFLRWMLRTLYRPLRWLYLLLWGPYLLVRATYRLLRGLLRRLYRLLRYSCRHLGNFLLWAMRRSPRVETDAPHDSLEAKRSLNWAKLDALLFRRQDSCLHAFSAFAAITTFVTGRRLNSAIPKVHVNFLLGYFSPIAFGFALSMVTFCLYPLVHAMQQGNQNPTRFFIMIPSLIWFVHGLVYVAFTLRQDFTALFNNYFHYRQFPKSMTAFATTQIRNAPDLALSIQNTYLNFIIATALGILTTLYAAFLQSLP